MVKEKFVETKFGKIYYLETGDGGKTLVFLHGFGDVSHQIKYFIPPLEKAGYKVIAPMLPGHGKSFGVTDKFTFDNAVEALMEFLNKVCPGKFVLFGASLGGGLACEIARLMEDRVDKIILESPLLGPLRGKRLVKAGMGLLIDAVNDIRRKRSWKSAVLPKTVFNQSSLLSQIRALGVVKTAKSPDFSDSGQKRLFLLGQFDHVVHHDTHLLSRAGDVKLFPSGHHFSLSQPEGFMEEIIRFLNS